MWVICKGIDSFSKHPYHRWHGYEFNSNILIDLFFFIHSIVRYVCIWTYIDTQPQKKRKSLNLILFVLIIYIFLTIFHFHELHQYSIIFRKSWYYSYIYIYILLLWWWSWSREWLFSIIFLVRFFFFLFCLFQISWCLTFSRTYFIFPLFSYYFHI